jgi:alpha-galactosidase
MWTHWYHYYHHHRKLFENLDFLASHCSAVQFQVTELDDGYQSAWGDWTTTNGKFPGGLKNWQEDRGKIETRL